MKKNIIEEQTINDINYELLKQQFPHAVSIDEDGKYVIDPQKLQMSLDPSKANVKEDGYGLNWVGKKEAYHTAFSKNYKVLKPLNDHNSKSWDTTDNILIKGDNLDALRILRQNYFESIKMIYIDPPYNTKNDGFVYNDNFTASTEQTLEELGYDKEYVDYIENIQGAKTHSGWLSFMYPRLLLARDLLKGDGVIFISIDDNEVAQLKLLCDEIFGEDNFVGEFIKQSKVGGGSDSKYIATEHEYVLTYSKSLDNLPEMFESHSKEYLKRYKEEDQRGKYFWDTLARPGLKNPINYDIELPDGSTLNGDWIWSKTRYLKELSIGNIRLTKKDNNKWMVHFKQYLNLKGKKPRSMTSDFGGTYDGKKEIEKLFGNDKIFVYPKSTKHIVKLLEIIISKNDIILDFFAGSGTTAHAVMDLNAQDGGSRKFIAVQWAEETPEKSEAKKAGYETIFDITQERIKRAGEKIVEGDITKQDLDIGFRTFEIVEDTKQKIYQKSLEEMTQEDLLTFTESKTIESNEEILFNLFVAEALPLSTKYEELICDKLYLASNVAFILGDISSDELVEALIDKKECEYITVYSPNISDDKFTLEIESNISKIGIKSDKLRFRG